MSWFGWLLKSRYDVTLLDRLIGTGEAIGLVVVFLVVFLVGYGLYYKLFVRQKDKLK
jgi:hypothetical protein